MDILQFQYITAITVVYLQRIDPDGFSNLQCADDVADILLKVWR